MNMKTIAFWTLVCLNVALLAAFVSRMSKPNIANAQTADRPGDYIMIPGSIIGGVNDIVYVLDQTGHKLGAMTYDDSNHSLVPLGPTRDLDRDFDAAGATGNHRR